ncbi:MAG: glycosyltransferase [Patescibacteria group bacterium]|nr:glycosyltransferase [Patescibacteria group bacterium]
MKIHISNCSKKAPYQFINLLADAFEKEGHRVFKFDDRDYTSVYLKVDSFIRRSPLFLLTKHYSKPFDFKQKYKEFIGEQWLKTLKDFNPDVVLIVNTGWLSQKAVSIAREKLQSKFVFWVVDNPVLPAAEDLISFLPYCNILLVADSGWIPLIGFFNKNVVYLPLASSDICYKTFNQPRDLDFSFTGSFFPKESAGFLRAYILSNIPSKYKAEIYGYNIGHFLNIYPKLKNFNCYNKNISESYLNNLWNRSKLTAVIYHPQVIHGVAPRVFDAALTKTPQIIQYTTSLQDLFPGIAIPTFKSTAEFSEKVEYYLSHLKEREELAEEMFDVTKNNHLFIHRVRKIMELLNK